MPFFSHLDENADITDTTFNDRKRLGPMDEVSQRIMRGKSPFSSAEKETMAAFVSGLNACQFFHGSHKAVAREFGAKAETIELLVEEIDSAPVEERFKPIFHYLKKPTTTPAKLTQSDWDKVLHAGWARCQGKHAYLPIWRRTFAQKTKKLAQLQGNVGWFFFILPCASLTKH